MSKHKRNRQQSNYISNNIGNRPMKLIQLLKRSSLTDWLLMFITAGILWVGFRQWRVSQGQLEVNHKELRA